MNIKLTESQKAFLTFISIIFLIISLFVLIRFQLIAVLISVVIAYALQKPMHSLQANTKSSVMAATILTISFIGVIIITIGWLAPLIWVQAANLIKEIPSIISVIKSLFTHLPEKFPNLVAPDHINKFAHELQANMSSYSKQGLLYIINSISAIATALIYILLIPFMLFFLLRDHIHISKWFGQLMPKNNALLTEFWTRLDIQLGNYLRGKLIEIIVISIIASLTYTMFALKYSLLLGLLVGISVLIPVIGATIVTIPVAAIALWQFGFHSTEFLYIIIAHSIIMIVDGNVLVPMLFSEQMSLHPLAIIIAILFFGGFFGFWGLFFAIPLATACKIIIDIYIKSSHTTPTGRLSNKA